MNIVYRGLLVGIFLIAFSASVFASDWDVAGKVLTGIEGTRILSGGRIDIIGAITGINRDRNEQSNRVNYVYRDSDECRKIWVANYRCERKWIPEHREFDASLGEVIIKGYFVRYRVKDGGYWKYECGHRCNICNKYY